MRLKKIIASVLSFAVCIGTLPATFAQAAVNTDTPIISQEQVAGAVQADANTAAATTVKEKATHEKGDVNSDGFIDSNDASAILAAYTKMSSNKESGLTYEQAQSSDVNDDGHIDSVDASNILAYYAYISTNGTLTIDSFLKKENNTSTTLESLPLTTTSSTTLETTPLTTTSSTTLQPAPLTTTSSTTLQPATLTTTTTTSVDPDKITEIKLSKYEITIPVGGKDFSLVTMYPLNSTQTEQIWATSNENIAYVSSSGLITGVSPGVCTVTVYSKNNQSVYASIKVTVTNPDPPEDPDKITSIKLSESELTITVGSKDIPIVTMLPETSTQKDEIWVSSDEKIATVNSEGWITAVSPGECTITVYSKYTPTVYASLKVKVPDVTGIRLSKTKMTLAVDELDQSFITVLPETAVNKSGVWTSSNPAVAKCDQYGWVKGVSPGTCIITVKSASNPNVSATIDVTVTAPNQGVKVTGITLSKTKMNLAIGELDQALVTMLPTNATDKGEIWKSSNTAVAKCDQYGWVKAVAAGTCKITVTSTSNPNVSATIDVTVTDPNQGVKVTGITLSKTKMNLAIGELDQALVTMLPTNATDKGEIWKSSNTAVAKCDQYGWVKAVAAGTCKITVTSTSNPNVSATIDVTVTDPNQGVKVTGITLSKTKMNLAIGELDQALVTMLPTNATDKGEIWTSSNPAVAKCDQYGWVKAVAAGTCKITVTSASNPNVSATIDVTVTDPNQGVKVTGITLSKTKMNLAIGELDQALVTMLPTNATDKGEIWTSSNTAVAKCDQYGWVKAVAAGTCKITVTSTSNPNVSATIDVTVTDPNQGVKVTGITLSKTKMNLAVGELDQALVTMLPTNATDKGEIWKSSNTAVAKCDQYGWVKAVAAGTCKITVTSTSNPNVSATIDVTVTDPNQGVKVTGITLSKTKMNLAVGELDQALVTMLPTNATDKGEIWKSSNTAVAKCDQYGWVKAVAAGTCKITVTSTSNPNVSATIDVTVTDPNQGVKVTGITLSKTKMNLAIGELDQALVTMLPTNATDKGEIWKSSNPAVAKCDQYGWVKGVSPGTCKITVTSTSNPNISAVIDVTVIA